MNRSFLHGQHVQLRILRKRIDLQHGQIHDLSLVCQAHERFDLFVEEAEFTESKGSKNNEQPKEASPSASDGFMNIPDGIDEELPFN